jgi:hypothetical protein
VPIFAAAVWVGLLVAVVQMFRGDTRPGTYVLFLCTGVVTFVLGLWFLTSWLNPS